MDEDGEEYSSGGKWIEMLVDGDNVYIVCDLVLVVLGSSNLLG